MHTKTVLITGATGFVGSHILEVLQGSSEFQVIAACRDPQRLLTGYAGETRVGDLRDSAYVRRVVSGVDVICHAAAWTAVWGHEQASAERYLQPSLQLIRSAREAGVTRFINTSTTSAAAPRHSTDALSRGIPRGFWPHLVNVIRIEDALRESATSSFQAVNLRLGLFAGARYGLGLLPMLVPRLKTYLVPWVNGGRTSMPIIDGRDIGQAFARAVMAPLDNPYEAFNILGPEVPTTREVLQWLRDEYGLPAPHFSVPFPMAYAFAWLMEKLDPVVPWDPLVTRSIVHLLEEVGSDNRRAEQALGYSPQHHWKEAVARQMQAMDKAPRRFENMAKALD